ncbi:MAG TPA: hypothetical protein DD811_02665 [Syntrophomonas sp.]|nr:hypothetical protein [Syntrophomonas sp.]
MVYIGALYNISPVAICYQIRQSFLPDEITPESANRIGYELGMCWTKDQKCTIYTIDNHLIQLYYAINLIHLCYLC